MSKRIPVKDLALGDFVERLEGIAWQETDPADFPLQSLAIRSDADINKIYQYGCRYVYIRDANFPTLGNSDGGKPTAFFKRLAEANKTYQAVRTLAMPVHRTIRAGRPLNVAGINAGLSRIVPKIARQNNALMWLTNLDKKDEHVVRHSINVCLLALVFGKHLDFPDDVLQDLAVGALLHDIGKLKVSRRLLNKSGRLTSQEAEEMNRHVEFGVEILGKSESFNSRVNDIVRLHHEHFGGGGFPTGLTLDRPEHQLSQIIAIVDAYDTMTHSRGGGVTADRAIDLLRSQSGKKFHPGLLDAFIDCVGDVPAGNLLELTSGEIGIELTQGAGVFLVFFDAQKRRLLSPKIIGLKFQGAAQQNVKIKHMLRANDYGLNYNDCIERAVNF